jgi:uncharacterized cofD-like protein
MSSQYVSRQPALPSVLPLHSDGPSSTTTDPVRVVAFGGGTGLATLLRGLKRYTRTTDANAAVIESLTAVVAVSDDGGSSGRLRLDLQMLPPGDIRNCLVALADDEALLSRVFQHRFTGVNGLDGHSFGNLFLAAMTAVTQDFVEAIKLASVMLGIRGRILPATSSNIQLYAEMNDGTFVFGETSIAESPAGVRRVRLMPASAEPLPETLEAIAEADLIAIGPGSLYTSVIPNLLVNGIPQAIAASGATKVYVCNLMTQPHETTGYTAADHIRAIYEHAGLPLFDYVMVNRAALPPQLAASYAEQHAAPVECDVAEIQKLGVKLVEGEYIAPGNIARHAAEAVAADMLRLAATERAHKTSRSAITAVAA